MVERLTSSSPRLIFSVNDGCEKFEETFASKLNVDDALNVVYSVCKTHKLKFIGVGHRVVHGGIFFNGPVVVDRKVKEKIRDLFDLAPVHNPINLSGVEYIEKKFPGWNVSGKIGKLKLETKTSTICGDKKKKQA